MPPRTVWAVIEGRRVVSVHRQREIANMKCTDGHVVKRGDVKVGDYVTVFGGWCKQDFDAVSFWEYVLGDDELGLKR